jgi:hypothetical protein
VVCDSERDSRHGELAGGRTSATGFLERVAGPGGRIDQGEAAGDVWGEKAIEEFPKDSALLASSEVEGAK